MDTRTQILSIASDLLQRQTVNGFSLQDVADRVGIRKASLFHHYRNKEALVADVLENSLNGFRKRMQALHSQPAQRQLDAFLDIYQRHIGAGSRLCSVSGVTGDWDHLGEASRRLAEQIMVRIQGAMLLSRVQSSPLPLERIIAQLRTDWLRNTSAD